MPEKTLDVIGLNQETEMVFRANLSNRENGERLVTGMDAQTKMGVRFVRDWAASIHGGMDADSIKTASFSVIKPIVREISVTLAEVAVSRLGLSHETGLRNLDTLFKNAFVEIAGFSLRARTTKQGLTLTSQMTEKTDLCWYSTNRDDHWCIVSFYPAQKKKGDILDPTVVIDREKDTIDLAQDVQASADLQASIDQSNRIALANGGVGYGDTDLGPLLVNALFEHRRFVKLAKARKNGERRMRMTRKLRYQNYLLVARMASMAMEAIPTN